MPIPPFSPRNRIDSRGLRPRRRSSTANLPGPNHSISMQSIEAFELSSNIFPGDAHHLAHALRAVRVREEQADEQGTAGAEVFTRHLDQIDRSFPMAVEPVFVSAFRCNRNKPIVSPPTRFSLQQDLPNAVCLRVAI